MKPPKKANLSRKGQKVMATQIHKRFIVKTHYHARHAGKRVLQ